MGESDDRLDNLVLIISEIADKRPIDFEGVNGELVQIAQG
jgi:hypothetical protein